MKQHTTKDVFTYRPYYKVWLVANHLMNADDSALWGRLKVIEFRGSHVPVERKTSHR